MAAINTSIHPGRKSTSAYKPWLAYIRDEKNRVKTTDNGTALTKPISAPRNPNRKGKLNKASKELDRRRRDHAISVEHIKRAPNLVYAEGMLKAPGSMKV